MSASRVPVTGLACLPVMQSTGHICAQGTPRPVKRLRACLSDCIALRASFKLYTFANPRPALGSIIGTGWYNATFVSWARGGVRRGFRCQAAEPRARACGRVRPGFRCLATAPHTLAAHIGGHHWAHLGVIRFISSIFTTSLCRSPLPALFADALCERRGFH